MNNLNLKFILEAVDKITNPVRRLSQNFVARMKEMGKAVFEVGQKMKEAGERITEAGGFFSTRLTLPIIGLGGFAVRSAGQVEQLQLRYEQLLGTADKGRKFTKELLDFAKNSPFELADLDTTAQRLLNAGYATDEVTRLMKTLGQIAAGSGNQVSALADQYLDLRLNVKAGVGELQALEKANIPIVNQLAEMLEKKPKQIYLMAEAGQITFDQVKKAMQGMTEEGEVFFNTIERRSGSIFGVFTRLTKHLSTVFAPVGQQLWDDLEIADKIDKIVAVTQKLVDGFMALPKPIQSFIVYTGLILAALGPFLVVLGQAVLGLAWLMMGFGKILPILAGFGSVLAGVIKAVIWFGGLLGPLVKLLGLVATGFRILTVAMLANPIGLIIVAIVALIAIGYLLIKNWDKVSAFFSSLWDTLKKVFAAGVDWIMDKLAPLVETMKFVTNGIGKIAGGAISLGKEAYTRLFGDSPTSSSAAPRAALPVGAGGKMDAGGELKITINSEGRARIDENRPNDRRMNYSAKTGQLMGGY